MERREGKGRDRRGRMIGNKIRLKKRKAMEVIKKEMGGKEIKMNGVEERGEDRERSGRGNGSGDENEWWRRREMV